MGVQHVERVGEEPIVGGSPHQLAASAVDDPESFRVGRLMCQKAIPREAAIQAMLRANPARLLAPGAPA